MASKTSLQRIMSCNRSCSHRTIPFSTCQRTSQTSKLHFSSTSTSLEQQLQETDTERAERPRWQQTPAGMSLPFRVRQSRQRPNQKEWKCNDDPAKLDAMYQRMLGSEDGDGMLSDEVKWLAVTHKSFDQGKRGFNDKLSYLGRRIVELQTSAALVSSTDLPTEPPSAPDQFGRIPFQHPDLAGLSNITPTKKAEVLSKDRIARLGERYGISKVLRWKPKNVSNLAGSGQDLVVSQALYAIIGAIALERGGDVANKVVKEKILEPLGIP